MQNRTNLSTALIALGVVAALMITSSIMLTRATNSPSTALGSAGSAQNAGSVPMTAGSTGLASHACRQTSVPLGTAGNFRILAGTTVTSTGSTVIKGNLGVSPGSAVTGFPPGKVSGTIHAADTAAAAAQVDLNTAYNNAMGRTLCPTSIAGNIGGKTFGPGLYLSTSSLAISSGDVTLTAHGHPGAVFIFQVTTKFTTTSGRAVILAGGAQAKNIFWVVGTSATLGTTSVVYGNILAHKSISLATGAVLHGRALAHIGAVTMAGNKISQLPFIGSTIPRPQLETRVVG